MDHIQQRRRGIRFGPFDSMAPPERRRRINPATCERDYTPDQIEFMLAVDQYKRDNVRPFPTWSEILEVLQSLGYRKQPAS